MRPAPGRLKAQAEAPLTEALAGKVLAARGDR